MVDKHVLLYGYGEKMAKIIQEGLKLVMGVDVGIINAEGHEEETVEEIIKNEYSGGFEKRDLKVLMFVDFTDDEIDKTMDQFPRAKGLKRPIFCTPTEENVTWKFEELMDDLLEEELYFKEKDLKNKKKKE